MKDAVTLHYFNTNTPEYSLNRLEFAIEYLNRTSPPGSSLIDIGCGSGRNLEYIRDNTALKTFAGIDVAEKYLKMTNERVVAETWQGSITDDAFIYAVGKRFDFAVLAAVLHHLVGTSRNTSRKLAVRAIENTAELLCEGGYLILIEPVFRPRYAMDMVFLLKKFVTCFYRNRVNLLGYWNNIGAPVVSYYTNDDLPDMLESTKRFRIVDKEIKKIEIPLLARLFPGTERMDMTIIAQKI